jgi:hypothetical protein
MTKDPKKVEDLWQRLPKEIHIIGKKSTKGYKINWERVGKEEFQGARFVFTMDEIVTPEPPPTQ